MAHSKQSASQVRILAILHIVVAVLSFIIGIVQLAAVDHWTSSTGYGLWGGVWILCTGLIAYFSAKDPPAAENPQNSNTNCLIGTHMGFAICGSVMCGIFVIVLGVGVGNFNDCIQCHRTGGSSSIYDSSFWYCGDYTSYTHLSLSDCKTGKGLVAFLLTLHLLEFILAIVSSAYCCGAICCGTTANQGVVFVPAQGTVIQQGQPVVMTTTHGYPMAQSYPQTTVIMAGQGGAMMGQPPPYTQQTTAQYPPQQYPPQQYPPQQHPPQQNPPQQHPPQQYPPQQYPPQQYPPQQHPPQQYPPQNPEFPQDVKN